MDKQKRESIANDFKKHLKDANFGNNKDFEELVKGMANNPEKILDEDDSFHFDNNICTSSCDGHCCMGTDIVRVSPTDVDYMMKSPFLKGKDRSIVVKECLDIFLGHQSRAPMAKIKFVTAPGTKLKLCPFSAILLKASGKKIEKFNNFCLLGQEYKPAICMLFPLGRTKSFNEIKQTSSEWIYFSMGCPGTKTNKEVKIKDFLSNLDQKTKENDEYIKFMMNLIKEMDEKVQHKESVNNVLWMICQILYLSDKPMNEKMEEIRNGVELSFKMMNMK